MHIHTHTHIHTQPRLLQQSHTKCVAALLAHPDINVNIGCDRGWTVLDHAAFGVNRL